MLQTVCQNIVEALAPGELLIFDMAEPRRCPGQKQAFTEGPNWTCLVEYQHDEENQQLTRRIVSFRRIGETYRRSEEIHHQQLFEARRVEEMVTSIGFEVRVVRNYRNYPLAECVAGFVARKPKR